MINGLPSRGILTGDGKGRERERGGGGTWCLHGGGLDLTGKALQRILLLTKKVRFILVSE